MPETIIDLGRKVKSKHPEYADMSDADVGAKVKAKYPQEYSDFADVAASRGASGSWEAPKPDAWQQLSKDHPILSAPANTVANFGKAFIDQGVGAVSGAYHAVTAPLTPDERGAGPVPPLALTTLANRAVVDPLLDQHKKALDAQRAGHPIAAGLHGVASGVPVVGPMLASVVERAARGDYSGAAGEAAFDVVAPKVVEEGLPLVRPAFKAALAPAAESLDAAKTAVSGRITRSMIQPKEGSFDFGADPVKAAESIPHANTLGGYSENVKAALAEQESLLQKAIKLRHETASSFGANNTFDVAPSIMDSYEAMAKDAESLNKSAMAKNLRKIGERQIAELKARNGGSTWLDPDQILNEKRLIRDKVKFKTNEVDQMTTNEALANHYRALDGALDSLVPEAKEINARYSGLIELKDLVEHQIHIQGNAPILAKGNFFQSFIKAMPETAAKSRIIEMMNRGKEAMGTRLGGKPNVFYPKTGAPDYLANPSGVGTPGLTTNPPIPVGPVNWIMTPSGVGGHGLGEMSPAPVGAPNWMLTPSGVGTHGLGEMTAPDVGTPDYLSGKSRVPSTRLVRPTGKFTK